MDSHILIRQTSPSLKVSCSKTPQSMAQAAIGAMPVRVSSRPSLFFSSVFISKSPFSSASSVRIGALRPTTKLLPNEKDEDPKENNDNESGDFPTKKSRNELKREARRSVKWGMELAKFSAPQIKRVLGAASLDQEVFDAVMLAKRLGPDVREGKRRQFNYIGRLLREAQPELIEALIQASKDGDHSRLHVLSGGKSISIEDDVDVENAAYEEEEEVDGCENHIEVAARWFDGLIYKDQSITNEVYSVHNVDFDRQELRKLVRRVQSTQESLLHEESGMENDSKLTKAKKHLVHFLRSLAKESLAE